MNILYVCDIYLNVKVCSVIVVNEWYLIILV